MKRFLINITIVAAIVVALGAIIEIALLYRPNEYKYKYEHILNEGSSIKTLILGHSHAALGINPSFLGDSVFNMAIEGRIMYYDYEILRKGIDNMNNLECIICPMGYNFQYKSYLYQYPEDKGRFQDEYKCMYQKYMGLTSPADFPGQYWSEFIWSNQRYVLRLLKNELGCEPSGFVNIENQDPDWQNVFLPTKHDYKDPLKIAARRENLDYMRRFAEICKDHNIRLIFVTMPCYKTYTDLVTSEGIADMYEFVDSIREAYPALEYYNYMTDNRFVEDDFQNSSHLRNLGANKFSTIFREEVLNNHLEKGNQSPEKD